MKQLTEKSKKICTILIALIIIAGVIVTIVFGFNKELQYEQTQSIDIYIEQEVDASKIKDICNEVLKRTNMVQVVEIYEDMVEIRAKNITEEEKNDIVNKVKENYEFEQTAENTTIDTIPETRIRDMFKKYVIPFAIAELLIIAYMLIKYHKDGILKTLAKTIYVPVIGELLLLSIISITRIPVGRFTPIMVILMYILTIFIIDKKE